MGVPYHGTSRKESTGSSVPWSMLKMDVRDPASIQAAVSKVLEKEGRIDILVNNAGISAYSF